MPTLLLRQCATPSLSAIVEKSQQKPINPPLEYDLQLRSGRLDIVLLSKPPKTPSTSPDEGFESDIDSISLVSSENESFAGQNNTKPPLAETDSANGGSGSDSDTETEKTNTLTQKNVNAIKESLEKQPVNVKTKESHSLLDCVCYTDVNYPDILIFVIRNEAFVFRFNNLNLLRSFHTNFSTLKAVANQKVYNPTLRAPQKTFNLLQRTDNNGVTHIEITRTNSVPKIESGPSSIISITDDQERHKLRRSEEAKYSPVSVKLSPKKPTLRSSSIENLLDLENGDNLVKPGGSTLKKVWNSAEDLLGSSTPKRPERRRKKKPAPPPPQKPVEDVYAGQYVRVNVNFDGYRDLDHQRLIIKSSLNEPHPKKLQNFSILSAKNNLGSFLKPSKNPQVIKYPDATKTLTRTPNKPVYEKNSNSWTNSVPRLLKKTSRSKSEPRNNFQPMAYRYIDTTIDYPPKNTQNNALFLTATGLKPRPASQQQARPKTTESSRFNFAYNGGSQGEGMGNRLFGLSPKLRDFGGEGRMGGRWGSVSELNYLTDREKQNLKSVIKNNGEVGGKKKNEKKVTFSAYTTVQVV